MKLKFIIDREYDQRFASPKQRAYIDDFYRTGLEYLEQSRRAYQKSWNLIGRQFSDYIEEETGHVWCYERYDCVVSAVHPGISNWGHEPKIIRWWCENPFTQRRITAHELIISHYFEIMRREYAAEKLTDRQIWALAEIAAFALTSLTPKAKNFWPWDISGYYTNHNYPQIVDLQKKLKQPFLKRKDFGEYIQKGIKLIKNF